MMRGSQTETGGRRARVRPGASGFTVTEMLIVMVIIGLGVVAGSPVLRKYSDAQRTRAMATEIAIAINVAKNRAAAMNQVVIADFAPGSLTPADGFFTIYVDLDRDAQLDPGEIEAASLPNATQKAGMLGYELRDGVYFDQPSGASTGPYGTTVVADGVSFASNAVALYPDGTADQSGHITIQDQDGRAYAVTLTIGGAARVYHFDGSAWK